jgi:hypothetical protein
MLLATLIAIPLLLIWVLTLVDVVRRPDLGTGAKVLWAIGVLVIPVIGVIVYLIARPAEPGDRYPVRAAADADPSLEPMRHGPA